MLILVTRPLPEAWETKAQIEKLGHDVLMAPLMEIVFDELNPDVFNGASGLVATSRNALRCLVMSGLVDKARHLQVYAVGEATANHASELKLLNITAGRGSASDLVPVIAERHAKRPGHLVHLSGDHQAYDIKGALAEKGIKVETVVVYRQVASDALPGPVLSALRGGRVDAITLLSPRTAEIWNELARKHRLEEALETQTYLCLSDAVAEKLQLGARTNVKIAAEPKAADLLALI